MGISKALQKGFLTVPLCTAQGSIRSGARDISSDNFQETTMKAEDSQGQAIHFPFACISGRSVSYPPWPCHSTSGNLEWQDQHFPSRAPTRLLGFPGWAMAATEAPESSPTHLAWFGLRYVTYADAVL